MLTQICQYLRNWFEREILVGDFTVSGGVLTYADGSAPHIISGQYFRVIGSLFNDGVHKAGDESDTLTDEPEFHGAVWSMAVPPDVITCAADIAEWETKNEKALNSPYESESFGGYSYNLRGGGVSGGGVAWTNQATFVSRLAPWRKI